jgi:mannose-6-phosphate isomerase-like protein (cupin superfamily)
MRITSKAEAAPRVDPSGHTVFELMGRPAAHGGATRHSLAHIVIAPGKASTLHYHQASEETYYLLHGMAKVVVNGQDYTLHPGQACLIEPGETHQIFNRGESDLEFLAVCAPAWTPADSFEV